MFGDQTNKENSSINSNGFLFSSSNKKILFNALLRLGEVDGEGENSADNCEKIIIIMLLLLMMIDLISICHHHHHHHHHHRHRRPNEIEID